MLIPSLPQVDRKGPTGPNHWAGGEVGGSEMEFGKGFWVLPSPSLLGQALCRGSERKGEGEGRALGVGGVLSYVQGLESPRTSLSEERGEPDVPLAPHRGRRRCSTSEICVQAGFSWL